jgi:hypothetical protein
MSSNIITQYEREVNVFPRGRFVAKSEFEQGKYNYRHGLAAETCVSDEQRDGWQFCKDHGEKFGWMRNPNARGADMFGRAMMAQASSEVTF